MIKCARCDHSANDPEEVTAHALAAGHPLCPVCGHSLSEHEPAFACEQCLTRARADLAGIVEMYAELPRHLGHPRSTAYDRSRPSTDGAPLPGGDALVLLGPGSPGYDDDDVTVRDGDPASVAFELDWWQRDWADSRGENPDLTPRSVAAMVRYAAGYLEVHARWAANNHPGFDAFAADLNRLHRLLEHATARTDAREVAEAACMSCGGQLVREVQPRQDDGGASRKGLPEEGYQSGFTCQGCGRVYAIPEGGFNEYAFALNAYLWAHPQMWAPADLLADWFGIAPSLLRQWKHRGLISSRVAYGVTLYRVCCPVDPAEAASA